MSASIDILREASSKIPYGYCQCGCGQKTRLARQNDPARGVVKGEPLRFVCNHHQRGAHNNRYNYGLSYNASKKRWRIYCRDGTVTFYSRAVMEAHLGRKLSPKEVVHHINGDTTDDRLENLQLFNGTGEHLNTCHPRPKRIGKPRLTAEYLLGALRGFTEATGRVPRYVDLGNKNGMPSQTAIDRRFGNLARAIKEAGLVGD